MEGTKINTICWFCKKAGNCKKPIEGWDAVYRPVGGFDSWAVYYCPMFLQDREVDIKLDKRMKIPKAKKNKIIKCTNIETGSVKLYDCLNDAVADGFSRGCVSNVCNGRSSQHKGYKFEYIKTEQGE